MTLSVSSASTRSILNVGRRDLRTAAPSPPASWSGPRASRGRPRRTTALLLCASVPGHPVLLCARPDGPPGRRLGDMWCVQAESRKFGSKIGRQFLRNRSMGLRNVGLENACRSSAIAGPTQARGWAGLPTCPLCRWITGGSRHSRTMPRYRLPHSRVSRARRLLCHLPPG